MKILITAILLTFALTVFGVPNSIAEVYTWTDENGVKHFSDQPPADAKGAKPAFPAYEYDEAADRQRTQTDKKELQKVVKTIDENYEKKQQEEKRRQQEEEANQPPTMDERVAAEREKLLEKINQLESYPLDYFGSQRNKILTIGYYRYRLEDLGKDPEKYFSEPTNFEGNVRHPEDEPKYQ
jgi:hypothetical protein